MARWHITGGAVRLSILPSGSPLPTAPRGARRIVRMSPSPFTSVRRGAAAIATVAVLAGAALTAAVPVAAAPPATPAVESVIEPAFEPALAAARAHRQAHGAAIVGELAELLALPNVASDRVGIQTNAEAIAAALRRRGARTELLTLEPPAGDGPAAALFVPPAIFAELPAAGAERTLLVYIHYDGQPVVPERWSQPPWQPTLYTAALDAGGTVRPLPAPDEEIDPEWRLYARSAADDKAPIVALLAAVDALAAAGVERTVNLKLLLDGEEEAGSPHLGEYLARYGERLGGDAWLFCDGPAHQSGRPQLFFGVRGYTGLEVTVYGARRPLHSGHYGNYAPNPALRLARLLASMKDAAGRVLVDGFYDSAEPLGEEEERALAAIPPFEEALRRELGLAESEAGDERYNRRIALPSLNVRGLASATVGDTARNIVPAEATAAIDVRLVKGDDPAAMLDLVEAHIRRQGYRIVRQDPDLETRLAHPLVAKVTRRVGYRAVRTAMDLPLAEAVVEAAEAAAGEPVVRIPTLGGSLPLYLFEDYSGLPLIGVPIANYDNNQHAPDENLRLGNLWYGIDLFAALLTLP